MCFTYVLGLIESVVFLKHEVRKCLDIEELKMMNIYNNYSQ